eukprot:TRINITY_DN81027_c0_g1_i1.p1 TRINITY_DN81027_c0_g1~~TRINITY_DN81027_c0_g1_i1.p1  ORF type:complete len:555 (-),score=143.69 TRINITY_DN81027_c0_g1_i1:79-1575(-)
MEGLKEKILDTLESSGPIEDTEALAKSWCIEHEEFVGALKSLESLDMVVSSIKSRPDAKLTDEGKEILKEGSPEFKVYTFVKEKAPVSDDDMRSALGVAGKHGMAHAMRMKWIAMEKVDGKRMLVAKMDEVNDEVQAMLQKAHKGDVSDTVGLKALSKRKLIVMGTVKFFAVEKGPQFATVLKEQYTDLTSELLSSGEWKSGAFKEYNFDACGKEPSRGHLHPLLKVRTQFREIFLEMGFTEMPTNNFVESSFWNFDSLFQPQQHPARDMHDTFFMSEPEMTDEAKLSSGDAAYLERVKDTHEKGGYGSIGYRYDWKIEEARKNILRTHTTAVSSRVLKRLADSGFKPMKYFSIDRVFRNEVMDATHLCEFHQVEGMVVDRNLGLTDLIAVIRRFFLKIGISDIRFKPAYNPYTEPSMEIFGFHPQLKRWVEIGNSGIFRPEMIRPMGLPDDVSVCAWGLSLERPTMILYGIDNIRDLMGHRVDLHMVETNPICRIRK